MPFNFYRKIQNVDRVSYERCCCGLAIPLMYQYLYLEAAKKGAKDSAFHIKIKAKLDELLELIEKKPDDKTINERIDVIDRQIFGAGKAKEDITCEDSVRLFSALYGAETGNLALKILPYGGVYLLSSITHALKESIIKDTIFIVRVIEYYGFRTISWRREE